MTLAMVLLIGSLMIGAVLMMLTQTQVKQKLVKDSLETSKLRNAVGVAQVRVESLLRQYPMLLLYPPDFWEAALTFDASPDAQKLVDLTRLCQPDDDWKETRNVILPYARSDDIHIYNNTFFRLINITHSDNNKALITIQAKNKQGVTANLQAEVKYKFYYVTGKAPGLWTKQKTKIRSEFNGGVWLNNCQLPTDSIRFSEGTNQAIHVGNEFPELPNLDKIIERIPKSHIINLNRNYDGETSFPRSQDSPTERIKGYIIYEYFIENFDTNQPIEIKTVVNGKPVMVIFHTKHGITKGKITHTCESLSSCPAENLIFINHATNQNYKMCFKTDQLNAFIFSPNAGVGFTSRNKKYPEVSGAIWTKELVSERNCGDYVKVSATLTFEQIIRDFQIISPYAKITEVSEFRMVTNTVIESESDSRIRVDPFSSLGPNNMPVFIDDDFDNP